MNNYYDLLGVKHNATINEIKKAFRNKAKRLHPDIAGKDAEAKMHKLLAAYETLSNEQRRFEYDRVYIRFTKESSTLGGGFNYKTWLREDENDLVKQSKLILFELLHLEEDEAISIWRKNGGINFNIERFIERDDWMDCCFFLAEELNRRRQYYESFRLLVKIIKEERRLPYFRLYTPEIEKFIKEIINYRLRPKVDDETWLECLGMLLNLGFSAEDEAVWTKALAEAAPQEAVYND